jgi:hypothetical protein
VTWVTPLSGKDESAAAIERFLDHPAAASSYEADRRLEASGYGQSGWMDVHTRFSTSTGLQNEVAGEGGSGSIRSRVLKALLEEERRMLADGRATKAAVSRANYRFTQSGAERDGLIRIALEPLRKERTLLDGSMYLNPDDATLARIEGRLAKNPSWWISRVHVVRQYRKLNSAVLPVSMESVAQLRMRGSATLRMSYRYTKVNGKPVHTSH